MSGYTAEQLAAARQLSQEFRSGGGKSRGRASGKSASGFSGSLYHNRASIHRPQASHLSSVGSHATRSGRVAVRGNGSSKGAASDTQGRLSGTPARSPEPASVPTFQTATSPFTNLSYSPVNPTREQNHASKPSDKIVLATKTVASGYTPGNHGSRPGVPLPAHLQVNTPMVAGAQVRNDHLSACSSSQIDFAVQTHAASQTATEDNKTFDALCSAYAVTLNPLPATTSAPDHRPSPKSPEDGYSNPEIIEVEVAGGQKAKVDTSQPVLWNWMSGETPKVRPPTAFAEDLQSPAYDSADIFSKKPLGHCTLSPILEPVVHFDFNLPPPVVEFYQSPSDQLTGRGYGSVRDTPVKKGTQPALAGSQQETCTCNRDLSTIKGLGSSRFSQGDMRPVQNQNCFTGTCPVHYERRIHELDASLSSFTL